MTKHPGKWLAVHFGDYLDVIYKGTPEEKIMVFEEMILMELKMIPPKLAPNILTLARSHAMWHKKVKERKDKSIVGRQKHKELKEELKEAKIRLGELPAATAPPAAGIYDSKLNAKPTLEEALAFGETIGASKVREWFALSESSEWQHNGRPIRHWKRALASYEEKHTEGYERPQQPEGALL